MLKTTSSKFVTKLVILACFLISSLAEAALVYGSGGIARIRDCSSVPDGQFCVGSNPTLDQSTSGGSSNATGLSISATATGFGTANTNVSFNGAAALPEMRVETISDGQGLVTSISNAQQGYMYSGSASALLPLIGTVDFLSNSIGDSPSQDPFVSVSVAGQTFATGSIAILSSPLIESSPFFGPGGGCGTAGVLAFGSASTRAGGAQSLTIDASQSCSGGSLTINPGDEFHVWANLGINALKGGQLDALNTFTIAFGDNLTEIELEMLMNNMTAASDPNVVPLPATAPLFLAGLVALGAFRRWQNRSVT